MTRLFLVFTILTVAAVTITIVIPASANEDAASQISQTNIKSNEPTFLIFLDSEYKRCLGTLVHEQWVLTAAHCFLPFLKVYIATSNMIYFPEREKLKYNLVIQHPKFTRDSAEHDLMLIKLENPLKLGNGVKLAVLPNTTDDRIGARCTVLGWIEKNQRKDPDNQINVDVIWFPREDCQGSPVRQIPVQVSENMFCAGSSLESTHSCWEIGAAPILCQHQLQGVLSWSEGCVLRGDIGYYTKVSHYTDWILKVIHTK